MCFSATASFASSAALISVGSYLLHAYDLPTSKKYLLFIPIIFGIQQFSEGIVWLSLENEHWQFAQILASHLFSAIATTLWPIFIPFAMYHYQNPGPLKMIQAALLLFGCLLGLYLLYCSNIYSELLVDVNCSRIDCHSIAYRYQIPFLAEWVNGLYLIPVILPFAFCQNRVVRYLVAPCFLFSFLLASYLAQITTFPSIWCFLAASMSSTIFLAFIQKQEAAETVLK